MANPTNGSTSGSSRLFCSPAWLRQYSETDAALPCVASRTAAAAPPKANAPCGKACRSVPCVKPAVSADWARTPYSEDLSASP